MKRVLFIIFIIFYSINLAAKLPSVILQDMYGERVNVESLTQKGKPIVISFFATWCKPCLRELKAIDELYEEWQEETGVELYVVSIDQAQDIRKVRPLVESYGWSYNVLLDPNGELKRAMNVQTVPHLFIIDGKGNIIYNHSGYSDGDEYLILPKIRN